MGPIMEIGPAGQRVGIPALKAFYGEHNYNLYYPNSYFNTRYIER